MLAFGSCNRQNKPQTYWVDIESLNPTHFSWIGDAVYSKGTTMPMLHTAYHNLTSNPHYSEFAKKVIIDGVWDDHDYGVNDAGKYLSQIKERKAAFLHFLNHGTANNDIVINNEGLYHAMDIVINEAKVKVIFLDTRTFRDNHWIRSFGEVPIKGSALIAAALRTTYSTLGFARQYNGEMLGEHQWQWLEETLQNSTATGTDAHIIVSSVQVLTTNPVFESWGHFPVEKKRLFDLLKRTDPKALTFLSGDVHLAEISQATYTRADGTNGSWIEVTSSGLTHSCADGFTGLLCTPMMSYFAQHRRSGSSLFLGKNFGTVGWSAAPGPPSQQQAHNPPLTLNFTIFSLESTPSPVPVLTHVLPLAAPSASPIASVEYADFPRMPPAALLALTALLLLLLRFLLIRSYSNNSNSNRKTSNNSSSRSDNIHCTQSEKKIN